MQLPPAVPARLAGASGAAEPLAVERDPRAGSAPFLFAARRLHFPRDHAFFEEGDVQRHLYLQDVLAQVTECPERPRVPEFACQVAGCCRVFDTLGDYEHHYHVLHDNVCSFCKRAFPSGQLLDTHILEWHDALFQLLAQRQDMYQCLVEGCTEKFRTSGDRREHLPRHRTPVRRGPGGGRGGGRRGRHGGLPGALGFTADPGPQGPSRRLLWPRRVTRV
ncbi:zinc finger protein 511 isoform X2 [Erinaceus europaeus]|uniref:Zinc finger protein 511 isoform X2 n=1 Tax=Erinaceus europaeus TaxID=9365 RepID=A0ABM3VRS0_ERIEU|nr:zinc finger protein 511 isoform X2 [Erinaceus europaeus]